MFALRPQRALFPNSGLGRPLSEKVRFVVKAEDLSPRQAKLWRKTEANYGEMVTTRPLNGGKVNNRVIGAATSGSLCRHKVTKPANSCFQEQQLTRSVLKSYPQLSRNKCWHK